MILSYAGDPSVEVLVRSLPFSLLSLSLFLHSLTTYTHSLTHKYTITLKLMLTGETQSLSLLKLTLILILCSGLYCVATEKEHRKDKEGSVERIPFRERCSETSRW